MVGKIGKTPIILWMATTSTQPIQDVTRQPNPGTLLSQITAGESEEERYIHPRRAQLLHCIFTIV